MEKICACVCERGYFIYSLFVWCCPHTVKAGQWLGSKIPAGALAWRGKETEKEGKKEGRREIGAEGEKEGVRRGRDQAEAVWMGKPFGGWGGLCPCL